MRIARERGAFVALDLVPHDAHKHFQWNEIAEWFQAADLVITEVRTARLAMGLAAEAEVRDSAIALDTADRVSALFPDQSFHLRFGDGNIDQTLVRERDRPTFVRQNAYKAAPDPRGFGDQLSAADVADYLAHAGSCRNFKQRMQTSE